MTIIWAMVAAACLTLGALHLLVWCKKRAAWANLLFSLTSVSTGVLAGCEFWMMRTETPEQFATACRWTHVPVWVITLSLLGFVRMHLAAGRLWLIWLASGLRTASLILNFLLPQNLNYREVTGLRHVSFLGESISVGQGVSNPWMVVAQLSLVLSLVFVVDAAITAWRGGQRRKAFVTGGSISLFVLAATIDGIVVGWHLVAAPLTASIFFLGIVAAMSLELADGVLRAAKLSDELRESELRFRGVADTAPVMIWMSGTDKLCNFFNKGWLSFTGRAVEKELGDGWTEGVHPQDLSGCVRTYREAFDARRPFTMEYRLRRHDGEYRWISDTGVPRYDPRHNFLGYIGSCVDLTENKQADERFRLAVEASPSGIVLVNREGRILLVNAETEKIFGFKREELLGQTIELLVPERHRGAHPGDRASFFAAPQARAMGAARDLFARRKDGTEFPVEIGLSPIESDQGTLVMAAIVDITARKQAELQISQQRNELAHLSRVATVTELSGSLAHELNQPLGIILSNAQAAQRLLDQDPPDVVEVRDILADIVGEDQRAGEVIRRLRTMLKRGKTELQPLAMNEVVEEVLRLARSDLLEHCVLVERNFDLKEPRVLGDRVQIQQVLLNLVLNACDAMTNSPTSGRQLSVMTASEDGAVRVSISDTGGGLADPQRLFEPFYTTKSSGLGLGLSICRSIVGAHKGRLWAEASQSKPPGAIFHLELPALKT